MRFRCALALDDDLQRFAAQWLADPVETEAHPVVVADGATVTRIYCRGPFQIERCRVPAGCEIPAHVHPHADTIEVGESGAVRLVVNGTDPFAAVPDDRLSAFTRGRGIRINAADLHGGRALGEGATFLSVQRWAGEPKSVLTDYVGTPTRAVFAATILSYVDTPFHHQGRLPGVGLDCPGPGICAAWDLGLAPRSQNITGYSPMPDGKLLKAYCDEHMDAIDYADRRVADMLLVCFQHGHPQHLGVLVEIGPDRQYWVEAEGYRHKRVLKSRVILTDRHTQLIGTYRVRGLAP